MELWNEKQHTTTFSQEDHLWLDDTFFANQQRLLPAEAPRAALLYRVSTKGQVDPDDIPMQRIACRKFAQAHQWRVVLEEAEKGVSGSKVSAANRDVVQDLRAQACRKAFDVVLVYMFDRLGRIESETPFVLEWFVQHGIQMWSIHEGQQKIENHSDKLMNYIRFWMAAGESEKTSIRTKDRLQQIISSGHFAGGFVPYGYRAVYKGRVNKRDQPVRDLEINPEEAEWVKEVFHKVAEEGASGYAMAQMLNDRGFRTRQGAKFQSSNIRRLIQHEGYTGYLITKHAKSSFIPELQIIDSALFTKANQMLNKRKRSVCNNIPQKSTNPTLLAGIVVCGHCGAKMSAFLHTDRYKLVDGTIRERVQAKYNCYQRAQHLRTCDGQCLYLAKRVDKVVLAYISILFQHISDKSYEKQVRKLIQYNNAAFHEQKKSLENDLILAQQKKQFYEEKIVSQMSETISVSVSNDTLLELAAQAAEELNKVTEVYHTFLHNNDPKIRNQQVRYQYKELLGWAKEFPDASLPRQRCILSQLLDHVELRKGYAITIKLKDNYKVLIEDLHTYCL